MTLFPSFSLLHDCTNTLWCCGRRKRKRIVHMKLHSSTPTVVAAVFLAALSLVSENVLAKNCLMGTGGNCTAAAFRAGLVQEGCITNDGTGTGSGCTTDPCQADSLKLARSCVLAPFSCAVVPNSQIGCISRQLLCWSFNQTQCSSSKRPYCSWVHSSGYCNYTSPAVPVQQAAAQEVANSCPVIHPVVLAILIVMFITLIAAVLVVVVVVVMNKKKQDEIEREEEEAEAEAAVGNL